jgi:hypothetical protein
MARFFKNSAKAANRIVRLDFKKHALGDSSDVEQVLCSFLALKFPAESLTVE